MAIDWFTTRLYPWFQVGQSTLKKTR